MAPGVGKLNPGMLTEITAAPSLWADMMPMMILTYVKDCRQPMGCSQTAMNGARSDKVRLEEFREEKFAYQCRVPPKNFRGGEITGTNDFVYFSWKIIWTRGAAKNENALQPALVRRLNFPGIGFLCDREP